MRKAFGVLRLTVAVVCIVALVARLVWSLGISGPIVANFFSYFTMESAIAATVLWIYGGITALRRRNDPDWLTDARAIVLAYQVVSGIVFAIITLESASHGFPLVVPWSSDVLHYVLPVVGLLEWLAGPGRSRPRWAALRFVLVFPVVWVIYTIIRGLAIGWFPYFFLDPTQVTGIESTFYCVIAAALVVAMGAAVIALGRLVPPLVEGSRLRRPTRRGKLRD